jgi:hypothetical protein
VIFTACPLWLMIVNATTRSDGLSGPVIAL